MSMLGYFGDESEMTPKAISKIPVLTIVAAPIGKPAMKRPIVSSVVPEMMIIHLLVLVSGFLINFLSFLG